MMPRWLRQWDLFWLWNSFYGLLYALVTERAWAAGVMGFAVVFNTFDYARELRLGRREPA